MLEASPICSSRIAKSGGLSLDLEFQAERYGYLENC